ncbi:MAG: hypothetical protein AB1428_12910 [Bacteroidota bacterium]
MNVVVDHASLPSYQTHTVSGETVNLAQAEETVSSGDGDKEILCGVLFTARDAVSVGDWLMKQGKLMLDKLGGQPQ